MLALPLNKITPTKLLGELRINSVVMSAVNSLISWKREDPILPDASITNTTSSTAKVPEHPLPVHKNQFGHLTVTTSSYICIYLTCKADYFIICNYTQSNWITINYGAQYTSFMYVYMYIPGMETLKSVLAVVGKTELITTSHSYTLSISLTFSDGIMNESLYIDEELMLLLAVTLLILLTCVLTVVHMMSTVLVIYSTIVGVHCNTNGWSIIRMLAAIISTDTIGSIKIIT